MNEQPWLRTRVLVSLFCLAMGLISIAGTSLSYRDEVRVAGIARGMSLENDFVVPKLNGDPFLEYPPLGYWLSAILFDWFGASDFVMHFSILLWGWGSVFLSYLIGRRLGGEAVGLTAAVMLQICAGFVHLHSRALVDPALLFSITLSLYGFLRAMQENGRRIFAWTLFYAGMSAGFLAKGLIGIGIPGVIALVSMLWQKSYRETFTFASIISFVWLFIPLGLWLVAVHQYGGNMLLDEVLRQSIYRFASEQADHAAAWYFYLPVILYYLLPLSLLLPGLIKNHRQIPLLPKIWFVSVLVVLSLASAKRNLYLAPIFPAIALAGAAWWQKYIKHKYPLRRPGLAMLGLLSIFSLFQIFVEIPHSQEESVQPFFQRIREKYPLQPIALINPSESLRGACVFYLGRIIPIVNAGVQVEDQYFISKERSARVSAEPLAGYSKLVLEDIPLGKDDRYQMQLYKLQKK